MFDWELAQQEELLRTLSCVKLNKEVKDTKI